MIKVRGIDLTKKQLAKMIDFSILHPNTTSNEILEGIEICKKYKFNSFCVNPNYLSLIVDGLKDTDVEPSVVLDFPFGTGTEAMKLAAAEDAVKRGAKALDMVIDIGALKDKNYKLVTKEIKNLVEASKGAKTKIIIEVAYLTKEEIVAACKCVEEGGGTYVKSSTGRADRGPTMAEVKLMRESVSPNIGVKVAGTGSFWTPQIALGCILAGADLIGTRSGPKIVDELPLMEEVYKNMQIL
ncbi:MAG: deoxyribose-phosphate aldolase [Thermoanaerobacteraceae bacterium]|jgi:deoxyribose-phosphate aldolase|nr:deoxyribose-phosphate aldolase [Thermoanaerobacteraceae bacterium]